MTASPSSPSSSSSASPELPSISSHEDDAAQDEEVAAASSSNIANNKNDNKLTQQNQSKLDDDQSNNTKNSNILNIETTQIKRQIDYFFNQYAKFTDKSLYTERGLKLVQWTIWLLSVLTKNNQRFHQTLSPSLRKIYNDLSMMRYVLRFYGLPPALDAAIWKPGSWAGSPPYGNSWKDGRIVKLANVMAWSMTFYHPLEHLAFVKWNMPNIFRRIDGNKMSAWSCRLWLVYIVADGVSAVLKNCELREYKQNLIMSQQEQETKVKQQKLKEDVTENKMVVRHDDVDDNKCVNVDKNITLNMLQIIRNVFFAPPCLNWSLDKWATDPLLSENVVNGMSLVEAIVCLYQTFISL